MLAEITSENGRFVIPPWRYALYSSDLTASSPRTAYLAALTWGLMLFIFSRLPDDDGVDEDAMLRTCCCCCD